MVSFAENKNGASWSVHAIYLYEPARKRAIYLILFIYRMVYYHAVMKSIQQITD